MQAKSSEQNSPQQANSLAERVRWLLDHFRLQQKELAQVMGVDVDRVKSLVLGRAKTLRPAEVARLALGLGVIRDWLEHGTLPALRPGQGAGQVADPSQGSGAFLLAAMRAIEAGERPAGGGALAVGEEVATYGLPPVGEDDSRLLIECVRAAEAELAARGRRLDEAKRLRLYWAIFELSLREGRVNRAAITPLVDLAAA